MTALGCMLAAILVAWLIWPEFIGERIADLVEGYRDRCRDHDRSQS